ncbi:RNA polymerase sigma-70 factor, ECF subfamily [Paenibacillus uliginis N3/975]|uniref:RNA polymerase sigma-70 factor, ECF subfamily n=1 Tax=Paenibacillus uliginis N3/975 TaxID=1313296 RepID=A0A1X7HKE5_9BACL|nr:RNA polymerase sigma-70 factor, ECF subfamily [Paenibacillus uliginis N3/975]
MVKINLKQYYPWYTQDEIIEISEEVYEAIRAGEQQEGG